MSTEEEVVAAISAKGDEIRAAKAGGATKADVDPLVQELLALKQQFQAVTGREYVAPNQGSSKKRNKGQGGGGGGGEAAAPAPSGEAGAESKKGAKKAARKADKEAKKREAEERRAKEEEERKAAAAAQEEAADNYGDAPMVRSMGPISSKVYMRVAELTADTVGMEVWIRARVHNTRVVGKGCFLLLRQELHTVQAVVFQGAMVSRGMVKYATDLSRETVVDVLVAVVTPQEELRTPSIRHVELSVRAIHAVSKSDTALPLQVEDASRNEEEAKQKELPTVSQDVRLNYRWIDMRTRANQGIFRIQAGVCQLFREFLTSRGFVEIHTPKLLGGASEGGSNVFTLEYFGQDACLAQSPQLYKQLLAACGGFERVFEVGPVFRAENSNTARHLCEFTGLDLEMAIHEHYYECLDLFGDLFTFIFDGLNERFRPEIEAVREQFPFEDLRYSRPALRLSFPEGIALLQEAGVDVDPMDDLSTPDEAKLGQLVAEKYGTDFFMMDKYPLAVRPFYTMPDYENPGYSQSYDMFIRGQEIVSGAQRIHDHELLVERARAWEIPVETIGRYVEAFRHGALPHAGGGIGLERVVMLFLGLGNIRRTSAFPRDPARLEP